MGSGRSTVVRTVVGGWKEAGDCFVRGFRQEPEGVRCIALFQNRCVRQAGGVSDVQFRSVRTSKCRSWFQRTDFGGTAGILTAGKQSGWRTGDLVSAPE
jgi:hypothetical protein